MRVGIIADGQAEAQALAFLVSRMVRSGRVVLKPVYADMQPYAPFPQIVRAAESRIGLLSQRGADRYVVLLDREQNQDCPGAYAARVKAEFKRMGHLNVEVVLKNRAFENWLVADLRSVAKAQPRRVKLRDRIVQRIEQSGADSVNAIAVLNGCISEGYSKRSDAIAICKSIDPSTAEKFSRSFRRFAKIVCYGEYAR